MCKRQLSKVLAKEEMYKARIKQLEVGKGSRSSIKASGSHITSHLRVSLSKGCRALGAGVKDQLKEHKESLKAWVFKERSNGHALNGGDLWRQLKVFMQEEIAGLQRKLASDPEALE